MTGAIALAVTLAQASQPPSLEPFAFAAMGDMPYCSADDAPPACRDSRPGPVWLCAERDRATRALFDLFRAIDAEQMPFVLHVGDTWSEGVPYSDASFGITRRLYRRLRTPMVLVPGDNEYTDCRNPEEAIRLFRKRLLGGGRRDPPGAVREPGMEELVRWRAGPLVFAGLSVPSTPRRMAELLERDRAFLREAVREARAGGAAGVVVFWQANPGLPGGCNPPDSLPCRMRQALFEEAARWPEAAFLLVYGDTHGCADPLPPYPKTVRGAPNLRRLEVTGGERNSTWSHVVFDPVTLTFEARRRIPGN